MCVHVCIHVCDVGAKLQMNNTHTCTVMQHRYFITKLFQHVSHGQWFACQHVLTHECMCASVCVQVCVCASVCACVWCPIYVNVFAPLLPPPPFKPFTIFLSTLGLLRVLDLCLSTTTGVVIVSSATVAIRQTRT